MRSVFALFVTFGSCPPPVPDGPTRAHPVVLRRERLNRQREHARPKGGR